MTLFRAIHHGSGSVSLTTSCTTPALAVRDHDVAAGGPVTVALTGPSPATYAVYLDVQAVSAGGVVTPYPGVPANRAPALLRLEGLPGCRAQRVARLPAGLPTGTHALVLFRTAPGTAATVLQTLSITVG